MSNARSARPRGGQSVASTATLTRPEGVTPEQYGAARSLVHAIRTHGHLSARLDPLGTPPPGDPALEPGYWGLDDDALARVPAAALNVAAPGETLADVLPTLRATYMGPIAYQVEHISSHTQRTWLRHVIETGVYDEAMSPEEQRRHLLRLLRVETFEAYLRRSFLGEKMFSIEGLDMMVLMLDEMIAIAAQQGTEEAVFGMAHRGRLNVLAHVLRREYSSILAEFEGRPASDIEAELPEGGTGDVKYHHGARGYREVQVTKDDGSVETRRIELSLMPNPSHLEFVNPVVNGRVRGLQTDHTLSNAQLDRLKAMAIVIHGDAAFPGQGIVAETLNLQSLPGYSVGGTVHLIANNQVGFTTDPVDGRSTAHSSDLAKGFDVPIIHVNADEIEACRSAVRLALAFRERFERDVLIDLVGYRRWGHNEGDEPAYTQPQMYDLVREHPSVPQIYADKLMAAGVITEDEVAAMRKHVQTTLSEAHAGVRERKAERSPRRQPPATRAEGRTPPDEALLRRLNEQLLELPDGFTPHPKLYAQLQRRLKAIDEGGIDWGHAEALAFASLIVEGGAIRLTGQDSERGTFAHRHLVLHDVERSGTYTPMQHLPDAKASFEVHNSPLSEAACVGFEWGYSSTCPDVLDIWEAQFGDFANGAQVIIDQFIAAGRAKWGQTARLTLFLPHGYEGSGPEHSSARLERFLQLAADDNLRIANPTTAAQHFHLVRWQATSPQRRPLIVMTPKGLLRLKDASSTLADLTDSTWQPIIDDASVQDWREDVERLVLCTGKFYYDIERSPERVQADTTAVVRVEQLYPFPWQQLEALVETYPEVRTVVWAQEEPKNMGAWRAMRHRIEDAVPREIELVYEGRPSHASPSEGYPRAHAEEQSRIVRAALGLAGAEQSA
jgi:2-oxoglutarate dehydrogenase E1 component